MAEARSHADSGRDPDTVAAADAGVRRAPGRVVAVTGARRFIGTELIKRLEEDERYDRVLALDIRKPDIPLDKTEYHPLDLTDTGVGAQLTQLLGDHRVDTVVHTAFLSRPTHAAEWAHELEDIGTMHVLDACAAAGPAHVVMASTTMVYGASASHPNYLSESYPLTEAKRSRFIGDKVRAERQALRFAEDNPAADVAILRFAPILGPTIHNLVTHYFARPVVPVLMGHDPLLQFVHESDAARALKLAVDRPVRGPFNIVGRGVLPYTTVLALMGRLPMPMPHFVARPLTRLLWATQIVDSPPSFLDFLRYLCVADGARAARELGFSARYSVRRTVLDFLGVSDGDGAPDPDHVHG